MPTVQPAPNDDIQAMLASTEVDVIRSALQARFLHVLEDEVRQHAEHIVFTLGEMKDKGQRQQAMVAYYEEIAAGDGGIALQTTVVDAIGKMVHLSNVAENRAYLNARAMETETGQPHERGLRAALQRMEEKGIPKDQVEAWLTKLMVRPVLTSHPTEPNSKDFVDAIQEVIRTIEFISDGVDGWTAEMLDAALTDFATVNATQNGRLSPQQEVEISIDYMRNFYRGAPEIFRELQAAVATSDAYRDIDLHAVASKMFGPRMWSGTDADGNKNITAAVSEQTIMELSAALKALYINDIEDMIRRSGDDIDLQQRLMAIRERLNQGGNDFYTADGNAGFAGIVEDIAALHRETAERGIDVVALGLDDLYLRTQLFGEFFAQLDIRLKSDVHNHIMDEIFDAHEEILGDELREDVLQLREQQALVATMRQRFNEASALDENFKSSYEEDAALKVAEGRVKELRQTLRPAIVDALLSMDEGQLNAYVLEAQQAFLPGSPEYETILKLPMLQRHPNRVENWIVSNNESAADLMAVQVLLRSHGLEGALRLIPLQESRAALNNAVPMLEELLGNPHYMRHVAALGNKVDIMVGYSDSTREAGPGARDLQLDTIVKCIQLVDRYNREHPNIQPPVEVRFFHGHGSSIPRGGGDLTEYHRNPERNLAADILANPDSYRGEGSVLDAVSGELVGTLQGRARRFRFGTPANAAHFIKDMLSAGLDMMSTIWRTEQGLLSAQEKAQIRREEKVEQRVSGFADRSMDVYEVLYTSEQLTKLAEDNVPWACRNTANISSRARSREADLQGAAAQAEERVIVEGDVIQQQRAIGNERLNAHARKCLPGWYGFQSLAEYSIAERTEMLRSEKFMKMMERASVIMAQTDFDVSWRHMGNALQSAGITDIPPSYAQIEAWSRAYDQYFETGLVTPLQTQAHMHVMRNQVALLMAETFTGQPIIGTDLEPRMIEMLNRDPGVLMRLSTVDGLPNDGVLEWPELNREVGQRIGLVESLSVLQGHLHAKHLGQEISDAVQNLFHKVYAGTNAGLRTPVSMMNSVDMVAEQALDIAKRFGNGHSSGSGLPDPAG